MPAELRKRKAPAPAPPPPAKRERKPKPEKVSHDENASTDVAAAPPAPQPTTEPAAAPKPSKTGPAKVGDKIDLAGFGGEIETHEGQKTTLEALVKESKAGVVLFTYPKASTPGCTSNNHPSRSPDPH